jgi:hypothetical protein
VTHRFHPLSGRSFEFVKRGRTWQSDRVYFFDAAGELASLPAEWTDVAAEDPFVVVSAGRSAFRTADLLELVRAENRIHGSDQQSCSPGALPVMITDHVPTVRVPPDHATGRVAAAVPA